MSEATANKFPIKMQVAAWSLPTVVAATTMMTFVYTRDEGKSLEGRIDRVEQRAHIQKQEIESDRKEIKEDIRDIGKKLDRLILLNRK